MNTNPMPLNEEQGVPQWNYPTPQVNIEKTEPIPIPRFPLPSCMLNSKSELQVCMQRMGRQLPVYTNESLGDKHALRWSATITLRESNSSVSISPIFKSKKDADKAVAYKALQLGIQRLANNRISIPDNLHADIGLLISLLRIDGVEIDGRILSTYEAGGYSAATATEAAFNNTEQQSNPPSTPLPSAAGETVEAPSRQLELPFVFPILPSSVPDFIPSLCDGCMQSATPRRLIFAFGRKSSWRQAWANCLGSCVNQNGVVLTSDRMVMKEVVDFMRENNLLGQCIVCDNKSCAVKHTTPCIIDSDTLQEMNLNDLFVTERPILLVDSSSKWTATWQWLVFFPTFHIASG